MRSNILTIGSAGQCSGDSGRVSLFTIRSRAERFDLKGPVIAEYDQNC